MIAIALEKARSQITTDLNHKIEKKNFWRHQRAFKYSEECRRSLLFQNKIVVKSNITQNKQWSKIFGSFFIEHT